MDYFLRPLMMTVERQRAVTGVFSARINDGRGAEAEARH